MGRQPWVASERARQPWVVTERQPWVASVLSGKGVSYEPESEMCPPLVRGDIPSCVTFLLLKDHKAGNPIDCRNILYNLQTSEKIH